MKFRRVVYRQSSTASAPRLHRGGFICSARWIWHLFISRRCYAVYDLRHQAPTTTTTRIPDPRIYLPPAGCPTSFFYPPRLPQERKEKKIRYKFSAFFVTPTLPAPCGVVASARLCCLSRVPPAVCPSLLESATTTVVCNSFLQSLSTYVHTPTHSILRFRPAPQTPDLHTSNLPHFPNPRPTQPKLRSQFPTSNIFSWVRNGFI